MILTGRTPLLMLIGIGPLLLRPQWSTVWLWLALVVVLVVVDLSRAAAPSALELAREGRPRVRLGQGAETTLVAVNTSSKQLRATVRDAWQPSAGAVANRHRISLPPGERTLLTTSLTPTRRGDRHTDLVTVRSIGPLGLAGRQHSVAVDGSIRSLPPFESRRHLPSRLAKLRELDGRAAVRVRGQGTEFDSLREYVRGDDVRSIDWRATARRPNIVVRTWQPERDRRVVLVLDTSRTSAARVGDVPRLDASMDAALLLSALAERAGDKVLLVAGDREVRRRTRFGSSGVAAGVTEAIADLEPVLVEANWDRLVGAVASLTRQRALVVLFTALDPAAIGESLLPVLPTLARRHKVIIAAVQDPALDELRDRRGTLNGVYEAAAAEKELDERDRITAALSRFGVTVVDATPERLPVAITDCYLQLKAAGRL